MKSMHYCCACDTEREFTIREECVSETIEHITFEYDAHIPYCNTCGNEIYISELDDQNIKIANRKYRELTGLIQVEEIEEVMNKYGIGQKPLASLLGWGEITIIRYLKGFTPRRIYSNQLRELKDPKKMLELFETNKNSLSEVTQKRVYNRIHQALQEEKRNTVIDIAKYFLFKLDINAEEVITPLKLQKLVYYAQGWMMAFHQRPLFQEDFQAWVHGPVVPELYYEYKRYLANAIPKVEEFLIPFSEEELTILEIVRNIYGRYDGKYLEHLTHKEDTWIKARGSCEDQEICTRIITKEAISTYFLDIKKKHKIHSEKDIEKYVVLNH